MSSSDFGFVITHLRIEGAGRQPAEIAFTDGVNVISGSSNTGKSQIVAYLDYMLGGSSVPDPIPEGVGYTRVSLTLRRRADGERIRIHRTLGSKICQVDIGEATTSESWPVQIDPRGKRSLSRFLLELCGLDGKQLRKNARGETRQVSYRDVVHLTLVDETRIISKVSPILSGQYTTTTSESSFFRLMLTGQDDSTDVKVPSKERLYGAQAKLALLTELIDGLRVKLRELDVDSNTVDEVHASLSATLGEVLAVRRRLATRVMDMESTLRARTEALRETRNRLAIVEGLEQRFRLLAKHYESDAERLSTLQEASSLIADYPEKSCPLCGAPPGAHSHEAVEAEFSLAALDEAARGERDRIATLRTGLETTLTGLELDRRLLVTEIVAAEEAIALGTAEVDLELRPSVIEASEQLLALQADRDRYHAAQVILRELSGFTGRAERLQQLVVKSSGVTDSKQTEVHDVEGLCSLMEEILGSWNLPGGRRVAFTESKPDFVVGGQPRASHGKGVRALIASSFTIGLLRWCEELALPHPGVTILDSPLVAYKPPEAATEVDAEDELVVRANVKETFYGSLRRWAGRGQIIVIENEQPGHGVVANHIHFTKSDVGRYGLFPRF